MRVIIALTICVAIALAQQQTKKNPPDPPKPPADPQVAAQVSALLNGGGDDLGAWCKTPILGLILAQQSPQPEKPEPAKKANPPK